MGLLVLGKDSLDQSFSLQVTHRPVTVQQSVMQAERLMSSARQIEPWGVPCSVG